MHEQSLVKSLLRQVELIVCEHQAQGVSEIQVEVGPLSGVEPLLLSSAFDQIVDGTIAQGAKLVINSVPLRAACANCQLESDVHDFNFRCPTCAQNRKVTSGDRFMLDGVTLIGARQIDSPQSTLLPEPATAASPKET